VGGCEHGERIAWPNQVVKCFAVNGRILGLNGRWGGLNGSCSENVPSVPRFSNWKRERERECVKVPLPGESQLNADLVI